MSKQRINLLETCFRLEHKEACKIDKDLTMLRKSGTYRDIEDYMKILTPQIKGFSVESCNQEGFYFNKFWVDCYGIYISKGDTYDTTIVYDCEMNLFRIISMGDFVELWESKHRSLCCEAI